MPLIPCPIDTFRRLRDNRHPSGEGRERRASHGQRAKQPVEINVWLERCGAAKRDFGNDTDDLTAQDPSCLPPPAVGCLTAVSKDLNDQE